MCGQPGLWVPIHWHRNRCHSRCAHAMCLCHVQNTGHLSCACSLDASSEAALNHLRSGCLSHRCQSHLYPNLEATVVPWMPTLWPSLCDQSTTDCALHTCSNAAVRGPEPQALELPALWTLESSSLHACSCVARTHIHTHTCMHKSMLLHSKLNSETEKLAEELNRHFSPKKRIYKWPRSTWKCAHH